MLRHLYTDNKGEWSLARVGLILTILLAIGTIITDVVLTCKHEPARLPNTVYALETSMFLAFVTWVTGPRLAEHIAPQISAAASALSTATREQLKG